MRAQSYTLTMAPNFPAAITVSRELGNQGNPMCLSYRGKGTNKGERKTMGRGKKITQTMAEGCYNITVTQRQMAGDRMSIGYGSLDLPCPSYLLV